ncbi:protein of unknown function [[Clostridium] ultunense Esp]|uniref:Uncharacterized protein n=1 Tax=[Clostridium] ultunense Esp TaxID=1288971 RepID=A0A1M4PQU0_9FIRM|nr:protein of unknown function [[Clostridium] ultunense Esp]
MGIKSIRKCVRRYLYDEDNNFPWKIYSGQRRIKESKNPCRTFRQFFFHSN